MSGEGSGERADKPLGVKAPDGSTVEHASVVDPRQMIKALSAMERIGYDEVEICLVKSDKHAEPAVGVRDPRDSDRAMVMVAPLLMPVNGWGYEDDD